MEQREKLIELLAPTQLTYEEAVDMADFLIANGVVVLPCKVGYTVYVIEREYCDRREFDKCDEYCDGWDACCERNNAPWYVSEHAFRISMMDRIGKSVFLTREEAERALGKRKAVTSDGTERKAD